MNYNRYDGCDKYTKYNTHNKHNSSFRGTSVINMNNNNNKSNNDNDNNSNSKRMLCKNMLTTHSCKYGQKCMYAHSLNEQKIDPIKHKVYTILRNNNDLDKLDLINDKELFTTLLQLTKLCKLCVKGICQGGYNCFNGAIDIKFKVCYDDLMYGQCKKYVCNCVHLTERKLVPYYAQKKKYENKYDLIRNKRPINQQTKYKILRAKRELNNPIYKPISDQDTSISENTDIDNDDIKNCVQNTLLTEKTLFKYFGKSSSISISNNSGSYDNSSDSSEDINQTEKMIEYLNRDNTDDLCNQSIFIE